MGMILGNGLAALLIYILVWILFSRSNDLKNNKMKTAMYGLRLSLALIAMTSIPVAVHLVWNGYNPGWMLPSIGLLYLAIISLVQILFIAAAGLLQTGLSIWLVKRKPIEEPV
jgi:ABC-type Co2+ transport system permease subunit